jgi:hypothetical protein
MLKIANFFAPTAFNAIQLLLNKPNLLSSNTQKLIDLNFLWALARCILGFSRSFFKDLKAC